jgi:hypothetical protein
LDQRRDTWRAIEKRADEGLSAHVISLLDAQEIRRRCTEIERHREAVAGELARLGALQTPETVGPRLGPMLRSAEQASMRFEERASALRKLDAWEFRITAGAAPEDSSVDFFGVAHVSFSFGAFAQRTAEGRVLSAREEELWRSPSELREQVRAFRDFVRATESETERAASIVARRLDRLRTMRSALEDAAASRALFARDLIELDLILAEAEQIFFEAWLAELRQAGDVNIGE